jgi:hypothetical protein
VLLDEEGTVRKHREDRHLVGTCLLVNAFSSEV